MTETWTQKVQRMTGVQLPQCQEGRVRYVEQFHQDFTTLVLSPALGVHGTSSPWKHPSLEGREPLSQSWWGTKAMVKVILHKVAFLPPNPSPPMHLQKGVKCPTKTLPLLVKSRNSPSPSDFKSGRLIFPFQVLHHRSKCEVGVLRGAPMWCRR